MRNVSCPDCGTVPVNHSAEKLSATLTELEKPMSWLSEKISKVLKIRQIFGSDAGPIFRANPSLLAFLAAMRIGTIARDPDEKTSGRARAFWLEAKKRNIAMWEFRLFGVGRELFVAEIPCGDMCIRKIIFEGLPRPGSKLPDSLSWVDDKSILRKNFEATHIPIARGGSAFTWKKTKKIFNLLEKPVIIKPEGGSRSRHTTMHIMTEKELRDAYMTAKKLSPRIIIEEELEGIVFRGTVIGGKVIGIRRKDPAHVIGDGVRTIRELVEIENLRPERQGPIYAQIKLEDLCPPKPIDPDFIPQKGEIVILSKKASIGLGGGSTDVTDIAHPDVISLLEKISRTLEDPLVGADFIVKDIAKPWKDQPRSGVIECNSLPFIDVHLFPLHGKPRDTVGALWDIVIADNKQLSNYQMTANKFQNK